MLDTYNENRLSTVVSTNQTNQVLYLCLNTFRGHQNHGFVKALELACKHQQDLKVILFHILEDNQRNNDFLKDRIWNFKDVFGSESYYLTDIENLNEYIENHTHLIIDQPYLLEEKKVLRHILDLGLDLTIEMAESNVLVPVKVASNKEEYAARTIRPKIWRQVPAFDDCFSSDLNQTVGEQEAIKKFKDFIQFKLNKYDQKNDPGNNYLSGLSPYLKYGFIAPSYIYDTLKEYEGEATETFLEELIIRRELSYNFIYYNEGYHQFDKLTYGWAYQTMENHLFDDKEYLYTIEDYIHFRTHDPYFNTAMKEMVLHGTMHGYMRMYWGKKVIEWSQTFEEAYQILIYLNNYYFLDGNTPNGYTGVAWLFGKHDRAFTERPVFGKIRYMNQKGLKRKFDMAKYVSRVENEGGEKNE